MQSSGPVQDICSYSRLLIYGTGNIARACANLLNAKGVIVEAFVDHFPDAPEVVEGKRVFRPDSQELSVFRQAGLPILIGAFNPHANTRAIIQRLFSDKWTQFIPFVEFYRQFPGQFGDLFWLTASDVHEQCADDIQLAETLWSDDKSLQLFRNTISFRRSGDLELLEDPDVGCQYFPRDVPPWSQPLSIIDCGAYIGDTLKHIVDHNIPISSYIAFEPDPRNYRQLSQQLKLSKEKISGLCIAMPCATSDKAMQLSFSAQGSGGSRLSSEGSQKVQCVSIDDALLDVPVNLIKMDVEGSEIDTLKGAESTIRTHLPGLAVCAYHEPAHLWRIPLLIQQWNLGYELYLRSHCYNGFDSVVYAVPSALASL